MVSQQDWHVWDDVVSTPGPLQPSVVGGVTTIPGYKNTVYIIVFTSCSHLYVLCAQVLFVFGIFQYITLSIAYSIAKPYRAPLYTNPHFVVNLALLYLAGIYINLFPGKWLTVVAAEHLFSTHILIFSV